MTAPTSSEASSSVSSADTSATSSSASITPSVTTVASLVPLSNTKALAQAVPAGASASTLASTAQPAADEGGLPQLKTEHWAGQMIWLVAIFLVFYLLLAKVFVPRLRKVIDVRGSTIAEDLANARANRDEAEAQAKLAAAETAAAHAAAKKLASDQVARVNADIAAQQAIEDEKLNKRLAIADARIRAARDAAMSHVREIASETAQALVEKLTSKRATAAALQSAFDKV
jgi:F-type H+-transporting ATPase subunit b